MSLDVGDVAGLMAGVSSGSIAQREARELLREWGTGDDVIDSLLSVGVGLAVGGIVGTIVDDIFEGFF